MTELAEGVAERLAEEREALRGSPRRRALNELEGALTSTASAGLAIRELAISARARLPSADFSGPAAPLLRLLYEIRAAIAEQPSAARPWLTAQLQAPLAAVERVLAGEGGR